MWGKPPDGDSEAGATSVEPIGNFAEAHRELLSERDIQFDLPAFEPPDPPAISDVPTGGGLNLAPFLEIIFWVVVALAAAGLVYLVASRLTGFSFRRRERASDESGEDAQWRPEAARARTLLEEADRLAAAGRYSEAAHLLLYRSIEEIDQRRPDAVRPALTSRDIAGLPALPPSPAEAFGRIVRAVERSLFGGRDLDAAEWGDCRSAYERFAFAGEWRG